MMNPGKAFNLRLVSRIIILRSEIDMEEIKEEFSKIIEGRSLRYFIKVETAGNYKHALYELIGTTCSRKMTQSSQTTQQSE